MSSQVTISVWLFIILLAVCAWAVLERVLIPSSRWFIRRRINRVIDEISSRLDIQIKPFQLTKRQVLIDRLVYDPRVLETIQQTARERECPLEIVQREVVSYAREIVPSFNAYLYFRIGYWIAKKIARLLYRVRIGFSADEGLKRIDPDASVVFVLNHHSNMDYCWCRFWRKKPLCRMRWASGPGSGRCRPRFGPWALTLCAANPAIPCNDGFWSVTSIWPRPKASARPSFPKAA